MKIVFMGTSQFAVPSLKVLISSQYEIAGVVSQPDRPKGRGRKLSPTPIKLVAESFNLPVYQPLKIKEAESVNYIKAWEPDLIVVVSYGQIIPPAILDYPCLGCINVHASLLPRYRGAAPIQRALMAGEKTTGVSTMFMDAGLDTGDIILQEKVDIEDNTNHGELEEFLASKGALLLLDTIERLTAGTAFRRKQDDNESSYASRLMKEDEVINWADSAWAIHNQIRALSPAPGAYAYINEFKVKIYNSRVLGNTESGVVGEIISIEKEGFVVQTGKGTLQVIELQKEGKKRMNASDFLKGFKLKPGTLMV
ncbi:MAG: methionyl-tRNA formyltransferase [Syntrophomonas sp.]